MPCLREGSQANHHHMAWRAEAPFPLIGPWHNHSRWQPAYGMCSPSSYQIPRRAALACLSVTATQLHLSITPRCVGLPPPSSPSPRAAKLASLSLCLFDGGRWPDRRLRHVCMYMYVRVCVSKSVCVRDVVSVFPHPAQVDGGGTFYLFPSQWTTMYLHR